MGDTSAGEKVNLPGFGTFCVKEREPWNGRNPRTGKPSHLPAGKSMGFRPRRQLLDHPDGIDSFRKQ